MPKSNEKQSHPAGDPIFGDCFTFTAESYGWGGRGGLFDAYDVIHIDLQLHF